MKFESTEEALDLPPVPVLVLVLVPLVVPVLVLVPVPLVVPVLVLVPVPLVVPVPVVALALVLAPVPLLVPALALVLVDVLVVFVVPVPDFDVVEAVLAVFTGVDAVLVAAVFPAVVDTGLVLLVDPAS